MELPSHHSIPINKLNECFRNTTATYKFYWLLAILDSLENETSKIEKKILFSKMISLSWYTINYFKLSFGKYDGLQSAIEEIKKNESIDIDASAHDIGNIIYNSNNNKTLAKLKKLDLNVPYRFLSPWIGSDNEKEVYQKSQKLEHGCPYILHKDCIEIFPEWRDYFRQNNGILKAFCFWNLSLFLQVRNPNVPDIPSKLERPILRQSLSEHKIKFWDVYIDEYGPIDCIYTGKKLFKSKYDLDHFIPFQFVAHNLIWNLIPADPQFNSIKSDKLPDLEKYLAPYATQHKNAFDLIVERQPRNKFIQQYEDIFHNGKIEQFKFENTLRPLLTIAQNNGFSYMK